MRGLDLIRNKRGWGVLAAGIFALTGACADGTSAGQAIESPFANGSVPSDGTVPGNDSTTPSAEGAVPCDNNTTIQQAAQVFVTAICPYADRCGDFGSSFEESTPTGPRESAGELLGTFASALAPEGGEGGQGGQGGEGGGGNGGSDLGLGETCDVMRACARDGSACGGEQFSDLDIPPGVCFGTLAYCAGLFFDALPCDLSSLGGESEQSLLSNLPPHCQDLLSDSSEPDVNTDPPEEQF